jgi:AbrB family looped-hinge helix DNA binding protein
MKAYTITPKGQVTIPAEIREKLKLYPGDKITYEDSAAGILIKPAKKDMMADFGFLRKREPTKSLEEIRKAARKKIVEKNLR